MMKVLTVFGTRPEAIKMAVLVKQLQQSSLEHKLCVTGQHRQMLDQVLALFEISPDFDLNIMQAGQDLTDVTCRILTGLRELFKTYQPDIILVHGDTTTCMAASLAAFYAGIKVGHVEAGLRTGNLQSPFPEEANRLITDRLANYYFAPTDRNVQNLLREGVAPEKIVKTGNTVIDALLYMSERVSGFSGQVATAVQAVFASEKKILLVTGHRRENFGDGFVQICDALRQLAQQYPDLEIVYPVHLNPNVQQPVYDRLGSLANVHLPAPMDYADFVYAMKQSWVILTDSGGVQEEAPSLGKPVLVMRDTTERPEAVEAGTVQLVGANQANIVAAVRKLWENAPLYAQMSEASNPYGDGQAGTRVVAFLESFLLL
ncbi:MAG: UDP-N-acetylglucosamine 2-epimerase (non-hydrolyzing) [Cytophagia bacterium]|nr:MAG: UDP-N-acetylglucosamine 2-epimerase (non-hydrolyzing) [Cytophagales bacterium]TAG40554.1 MAG: UDP-N-acetylglucosamine 2-epimerase (non-hydrolyzing) [Cytophagia bacterium]TAG58101.1 MAG: UDP-N-acetylglucosamine 2-epimerase (non-hydrolyzing) [Runella slithyformis]TAG74884.1 MAG: UDP-N-acetylglucosamine 2-epimerase (non-hydrolyzing) [Runella slithyformis]TAG83598.1 MAG: UDP-N-acetylglucosamine 2-epimerase (non-hydrolyzing) [Cytophagales bacterium]